MRTVRRLLWVTAISIAGVGVAGDDPGHDRDDRGAAGDADTIAAAASVPESGRRAARPPLLDLDRLRLARAPQPAVELFAAKSWHVAPPPPPPPPPPQAAPVPAKPTAPPLPFVFMGRMRQGERLTVFLVKGDSVHAASEGDVIDGTYRLAKIEPGRLTLVYLPLGIAQTLAVEDPA